jgi:hypothetical protein
MGRDPRSERHGTKSEGTLSREAPASQVAPEKRVKRQNRYAPVGDGWDGTGALGGLEESSRCKLGPWTNSEAMTWGAHSRIAAFWTAGTGTRAQVRARRAREPENGAWPGAEPHRAPGKTLRCQRPAQCRRGLIVASLCGRGGMNMPLSHVISRPHPCKRLACRDLRISASSRYRAASIAAPLGR